MQKDSAQAKISLKVVGGLLFLTHPVVHNEACIRSITSCMKSLSLIDAKTVLCVRCGRMKTLELPSQLSNHAYTSMI